jgi:hypothetical protein
MDVYVLATNTPPRYIWDGTASQLSLGTYPRFNLYHSGQSLPAQEAALRVTAEKAASRGRRAHATLRLGCEK